jgi:hypothetical protein
MRCVRACEVACGSCARTRACGCVRYHTRSFRARKGSSKKRARVTPRRERTVEKSFLTSFQGEKNILQPNGRPRGSWASRCLGCIAIRVRVLNVRTAVCGLARASIVLQRDVATRRKCKIRETLTREGEKSSHRRLCFCLSSSRRF